MSQVRWLRVAGGVLASILFGLLGLGAIIALVVLLSPAENVADVQNLDRFSFVTSFMVALGCAWGALVALRGLDDQHTLHGLLIGLTVGLLNFLVTPAPFVANLLTLLMALPAGLFGGRLAYINSQRRSAR